MPDERQSENFDTVIVGGGAAGLSAALVLGRCLRKVLVCDAGRPRNAPARIFNGYLSRDGSTPAEFLKISREQLGRYSDTVELRHVLVTDMERAGNGFVATLESGERVTSRTVLLATGLVDVLPSIENFQEFYGKTAHNCPYCDGWEVRGQPIAVTGHDQAAADLAIELLLWSQDVVLCAGGPLACDEKTWQTLRRLKLRVIEKPIARLEGSGGELEAIRFQDDSVLARTALFFSPGQFQRSSLAERMGCEFCEEDNCIQCDEDTGTCIPGLYAAGNCTKGVQLVVAAVAEGMQAAFAINNALLEADAASGALKDSAEDVTPA